jgi:hypothetical protein
MVLDLEVKLARCAPLQDLHVVSLVLALFRVWGLVFRV